MSFATEREAKEYAELVRKAVAEMDALHVLAVDENENRTKPGESGQEGK